MIPNGAATLPHSKNNNASDEVADATELARSQESLTAHLHRQALGLRLSETDRAALRFLIENLNDDGYLEDTVAQFGRGLRRVTTKSKLKNLSTASKWPCTCCKA
jgi:DNA-directed RNA polymerase specialized sigma54-like protein